MKCTICKVLRGYSLDEYDTLLVHDLLAASDNETMIRRLASRLAVPTLRAGR